MAKKFKGVYPALVSPFTDAGAINSEVLAQIIDFHIGAGVDGFYICGTTGEGLLQTVTERTEFVRTVLKYVKGRAQVIVHVGALSTKDTVALAKEAASFGVDAVSAVPPIFYKVPFEATLEYYRRIAEAACLPVLAYYIPGLAGSCLSTDEIAQMLSIENVIGLKYSDYNLFLMQQVIEQNPDSLIMSGCDEIFLPALAMGASGSIGLTLNCMPKLYVELYRAFSDGNIQKAQEIQYKANLIIPIILDYGAGGIAAIKAVMKMIGFDCGALREPLPQIDEATYGKLHRELTEVGFFSDPIYR